jgi:hypothetical protein
VLLWFDQISQSLQVKKCPHRPLIQKTILLFLTEVAIGLGMVLLLWIFSDELWPLGLGPMEVAIICLLSFLIFGRSLPEMGRCVGYWLVLKKQDFFDRDSS